MKKSYLFQSCIIVVAAVFPPHHFVLMSVTRRMEQKMFKSRILEKGDDELQKSLMLCLCTHHITVGVLDGSSGCFSLSQLQERHCFLKRSHRFNSRRRQHGEILLVVYFFIFLFTSDFGCKTFACYPGNNFGGHLFFENCKKLGRFSKCKNTLGYKRYGLTLR